MPSGSTSSEVPTTSEPRGTRHRPHPVTTAPEYVSVAAHRRGRLARRVGTIVLVLLVGLGAANVFGLRLATVSSRGDGVTLQVTYTRVARAGIAARWLVEVRRPGGFPGPIEIATTGSYFEGFDFNELYPEPSGSRSAGDLVVWTFDRPAGDVFRVSFDARVTPTWWLARSATTVLGGEGLPSLSVSYRTVLMP